MKLPFFFAVIAIALVRGSPSNHRNKQSGEEMETSKFVSRDIAAPAASCIAACPYSDSQPHDIKLGGVPVQITCVPVLPSEAQNCVYTLTHDWPHCISPDPTHPSPSRVVLKTHLSKAEATKEKMESEEDGLTRVKALCGSGTTDDGRYWLVIKYVEGVSLRSTDGWKEHVDPAGGDIRVDSKNLDGCKKFLTEEVYPSLGDLADYYAYKFGVLHMDIKLPNIHFNPHFKAHQAQLPDHGKPVDLDFIDWGKWKPLSTEAEKLDARAQVVNKISRAPSSSTYGVCRG